MYRRRLYARNTRRWIDQSMYTSWNICEKDTDCPGTFNCAGKCLSIYSFQKVPLNHGLVNSMEKYVVPTKNVIFKAILTLVLYYQKDGIPKVNVLNTVAVPKPPEEIFHVIIVETMIYMIQ